MSFPGSRPACLLALGMCLAALVVGPGAQCDSVSYRGDGPARGASARSDTPAGQGIYTILLSVLSDPVKHVETAKHYKRSAEKHTGWRGLFVVHKSYRSELYWGRYRTIEQARPNLAKARAYRTPAGVRVFTRALIVPLPGEDLGPPEWKLTGAKGTYTVLVAVFYDMPKKRYVGRKRFTIEYCTRLRKNKYPAYYFHGSSRSAVTIGLFGKGAVRSVRRGGKIEKVIVDSRMKAIMRDFPHLAVNGTAERIQAYDPKTRKIRMVTERSHPILIPPKKGQAREWLHRVGDAKRGQGSRNPPGAGEPSGARSVPGGPGAH